MPFTPTAVRRGYLLVLAAAVLWGTLGIAARIAYDTSTWDPLVVTWLRSVVAGIVCIAIAAPRLRSGLRTAGPRGTAWMALLGVALIISQLCYLIAIDQININVATLIKRCGTPIVAAAIGVILLKEHLSRRLALIMVGAIIGTWLLLTGTGDGTNTDDLLLVGVLLSVGSAVAIALHTIGSGRIARRYDAMLPLAVGFPVGALVLTPFVLARGVDLTQSATAWFWVIYLGVVPSALAYLLQQRGLRTVSASSATILSLAEPLTTAILAWFVFGELLAPLGILGGAILVAALIVLATTPADPQHAPIIEPVETG